VGMLFRGEKCPKKSGGGERLMAIWFWYKLTIKPYEKLGHPAKGREQNRRGKGERGKGMARVDEEEPLLKRGRKGWWAIRNLVTRLAREERKRKKRHCFHRWIFCLHEEGGKRGIGAFCSREKSPRRRPPNHAKKGERIAVPTHFDESVRRKKPRGRGKEYRPVFVRREEEKEKEEEAYANCYWSSEGKTRPGGRGKKPDSLRFSKSF